MAPIILGNASEYLHVYCSPVMLCKALALYVYLVIIICVLLTHCTSDASPGNRECLEGAGSSLPIYLDFNEIGRTQRWIVARWRLRSQSFDVLQFTWKPISGRLTGESPLLTSH